MRTISLLSRQNGAHECVLYTYSDLMFLLLLLLLTRSGWVVVGRVGCSGTLCRVSDLAWFMRAYMKKLNTKTDKGSPLLPRHSLLRSSWMPGPHGSRIAENAMHAHTVVTHPAECGLYMPHCAGQVRSSAGSACRLGRGRSQSVSELSSVVYRDPSTVGHASSASVLGPQHSGTGHRDMRHDGVCVIRIRMNVWKNFQVRMADADSTVLVLTVLGSRPR
ncbi:hypothetical protein C8Q74DRAFT_989427 [Fomes fomentarius]|nr:hypothetical protein C8Q74DRAFT_989427 [Fomes fomentarius]